MENAYTSTLYRPAFPCDVETAQYGEGVSKREYFAAKALQGLLANPERVREPNVTVRRAVELADALMAELEQFAPSDAELEETP